LIAVDSSVWIAHFRDTLSEPVRLLRSLFGQEELLVGDIVLMQVLRGARDEPHATRLSRELHEFEIVPMLGSALAVRVASNYRALRAVGYTVRKTPDLIIATYCIEHGHTLLHDDRDFEPIHVHLGLQVM
jgi:predicted nucleic acid-binding protein